MFYRNFMRTLGQVCVCLLMLAGTFVHAAEPAKASADGSMVRTAYRLAAGDEISIRVFGEPDMDVKTRLGESGVINFPLLGELQVKGLSVAELEQRITKGLKGPYLVDPIVSVDITDYRPFFVNGEVTKPGAIPFQPGITVRKAIAMSGGFTERAKRSAVDLISGADAKGLPVSTGLDELVQPGDIITVKESFF